ncbi:CDK5 regulatory subunit-associated protein 2-like [Eleutherodactylus coqui]|uniref:CDK5 regulatory subunit-associated protein 2-like n=1 Tax=Eleutherodactylus coqui TaxID=57060 RepID=UPI0034619FE3
MKRCAPIFSASNTAAESAPSPTPPLHVIGHMRVTSRKVLVPTSRREDGGRYKFSSVMERSAGRRDSGSERGDGGQRQPRSAESGRDSVPSQSDRLVGVTAREESAPSERDRLVGATAREESAPSERDRQVGATARGMTPPEEKDRQVGVTARGESAPSERDRQVGATAREESAASERDRLVGATAREESAPSERDRQVGATAREESAPSEKDRQVGVTVGRESPMEESACIGYERAWLALSGYEDRPRPASGYEDRPRPASGYEDRPRPASGYEDRPRPASGYEDQPHPTSGFERMSLERAHTMKDFEKQITELKKENFNLKLRIYFLEEQRRGCETSGEELQRLNIELKVEVESLKHDYREKQRLLLRASEAMESLAGEHEREVQRLRSEHRQQLRDAEDAHCRKIQLLEAEVAQEKAELQKMCLRLDQERVQSFSAEERLLALNEQYAESDWIIQRLNETAHSKDALVAQLRKQIASMMSYNAQCDHNTRHVYLEGEDLVPPPSDRHAADIVPPPPSDRHAADVVPPPPSDRHAADVVPPPTSDRHAADRQKENEWQKKIKEMDNLISELRQKLEANKAEDKNTLKRDKAIQGLSLALKKKTKENDKLVQEIDNLNTALSQAREAAQQVPLPRARDTAHPDYKKVIFTLQAEQDVYRRLLKYERESGGLQKEMESIAMLRQWLEENIRSNQELRKIMEAQIMAKYEGDDSTSFLGDQTSYFSICLDNLDQNEYFFSGGPQGAAVSEGIAHFGASDGLSKLHREDVGTQTQGEALTSAVGSPEHHQDCDSDPSFNERSSIAEETCENHAKPTRNKQKTVSSATETKAFSDGWISDASRFPESIDFMQSIQNTEHIPSQKPSQKTSNIPREAQNVSQKTKKSRLPVLLKSSLNTRQKAGTTSRAKENDHHCMEESQIQKGQVDEQLQCAEMDLVCEDRQNPSEEQMCSTEEGQHKVLENHQPSAELQPASSETKTLKAKEEMFRHTDFYNCNQREPRGRVPQKELQADNQRLSELLKLAQKETETLKEELIKHKIADLCGSSKKQRESPDYELQAENYQLSEQLKQAQMEIEALKAYKDLVKHKDAVPDLLSAKTVQMESIDQASQKELWAENHRLSEQVEQAQIEVQTLTASEELVRYKTSEYDSKHEQRKSAEQVLQKKLQAEIGWLSEQLKQAQMEIDTLKVNEDLMKHKYAVPSLSSSSDQRASEDQALQKENYCLPEELEAQVEMESLKADGTLMKPTGVMPGIPCADKVGSAGKVLQKELQAENYRLSEQLSQAKMEIEKFRAEESSTDNSDDSMKLHGSDADDDLSEQSCLDKTITNSVNVDEVDVTSDFGDEVCRSNVNSQNAVALRCHHDSHCTGCANRGIISFPTMDSKRVSTMHISSKFTKVSSSRRSFEDTTSLSKYDLLVQSQARELSLQRQKIKESHNLSVICSKNFYNLLKTFDSLFPASALDSNITLGFQEQITQTVEWLKELEYKLSDALYGEEDAYSDHSVDSLLYTPSRLVPGHRMWADKHGCHVLGLVEDYNALRKQILEARNVLQETEAFIDHGVQTAVLNMTEHFENIFFEKLSRTKQSLEEAGCLLKLLWRVSLPLQIYSPYNINQEEEANLEIIRLRKRVLEQEKLLSGMVKRVYSENQVKEDIEKLILDQLAMTHDILKKAKGNLEVQVVDKLH